MNQEKLNPDPFDGIEQVAPIESTGEYYGLVNVKVSFVKFVQDDQGAWSTIEFDPGKHDEKDRRRDIWFQIEPLSEKATFIAERHITAESKEWQEIVWKSLKEIGFLSLRDVDGKYVKYRNVPTGKKTKAGKDKTTFEFLALYNTRAEAEAAKNNSDGNGQSAQPAAQAAPAQPEEKQIALTFLTALAKAAHGDKNKLAVQIAQYPVVSKFYTIDSPEVAALLAQAV